MRQRKRLRVNSYSFPGALGVEVSQNSKLGLCSATYVAQRPTCPPTCIFLDNGCYAQQGHLGIHSRRLDAQALALGLDDVEVARNEARVIDRLSGQLPLRGRVCGDSKSHDAATLFGQAAQRYHRRYKQPVWTYTHSWETIPRSAWGEEVSVLASTESPEQVLHAMASGYAAALVVREFAWERPYKLGSLTLIPCPEQLGYNTDCGRCRLCMDDEKLLAQGRVIGFTPHGAQQKKVAMSLPLIEAA